MDLEYRLITLTTNIWLPGPINITTDCAGGLYHSKNNNPDLKLHIHLALSDQLNKNFNAVVD